MTKFLNLFVLLISCTSLAQFQDPKMISIPESYGVVDFANSDVDSDGFKDIISLNNYTNSISIYKNDSYGKFVPFSKIANIGGDQLIAADFDNDSDMDILVSSSFSQELLLIPNIGLGEYGAPITILNTGYINYLETMDIDGDSDYDIIINIGIDILCLKNTGGMNFTNPVTLGSTAGNYAVQDLIVGDINNDLTDDIIFYSFYNVFAIKSLGNGNFTSPQILFSVQTNPLLTIGDFNNDNLNDLLVNNQSNNWTNWNDLYLNNGNGIFTNNGAFSFLPCAIKLLADDIDHDGDEDVAGYFCDVSLKWYENNGSGSFLEHAIEPINLSTPYSDFDAVLSDYDNDNDLDFLSSNKDLDLIRCNTFDIDSFATSFRVSNQLDGGVIGFDAGDLNGDGLIDVVAGSTDLGIYYNLGNSIYGARNIIDQLGLTASEHFRTIKLFDIDADGDLDIFGSVVSGSGVRLYLNDGSGNFQFQALNCYVAQINQFDFGDYNGDGDMDILISGSSTIGIINNLGNNNFNYQNVSGGNMYTAIAVAFTSQPNMYGYKMIYSAYGTYIKYHSSNSNGLFSGGGSIIYNNQNIDAAVFYDIDHDNDKDLIITSNDSIGWRELTSGNLGAYQTLVSLPGTTLFCNQLGDYNNDGNEDLFFVTQNNLGLFPNQGSLQYGAPVWLLNLDISYGEIKFGDIENDGDKDLILNHSDYLEIALNEEIAPYQVKGRVFIDFNQNGTYDQNDQPINLNHLIANPQQKQTFSDYNGNYHLNFDSNNIGASLISTTGTSSGWALTTVNPYMVNITVPNTGLDTLDFGYFPNTPVDSIGTNLTGGFPRCNQLVNYYITVGNHGTTFPSGTVELQLNSAIDYVSSTVTPTTIQGNTISWEYDSLNYFENELIRITVQMPDFNFSGDTLASVINASILDGSGATIFTVSDTLKQILLCAYDPNDKSVLPLGEGIFGDISPETPELEYLVRFQNTGNDTAISVVIKDIIDPNLDLLGIVPVSYSHPMEIAFGNNREVSFIFNNILLPDSSTNEIESHGFVKFKIPMNPNLPEGTMIYNDAYIYFDSNPAVVTNTTTNHIKIDPLVLSVYTKDQLRLSASPNPTNGTLKIASNNSIIEKLDIYSTDGQLLGQYRNIHNNSFILEIPGKNGLYYVAVTLDDQSTHRLPIIKSE